MDKNLLNKPPENPGVFRAKIPRPRVLGKYDPPAPPPPPDRGPRGPGDPDSGFAITRAEQSPTVIHYLPDNQAKDP